MSTETSLSGKVWNFIENDSEKIMEITRTIGISDLVANVLLNRGFSDCSEISKFLDAKLKNTIPDPSLFLDMGEGVRRLRKAILSHKPSESELLLRDTRCMEGTGSTQQEADYGLQSKPPESGLLLGDTERRSGAYTDVHEHSSTGSTQQETDCGGFPEKVMIFGDYDVDGITSTYLLARYLSAVGLQPICHLPNRFADGYGFSEKFLDMAIENGVTLIITVDTGIGAIDEVEKAKLAGIDFIVVDHHAQVHDTLPNAVAVINPNRKDQSEVEGSHIRHLCAAGVVLMLITALQRELKECGFFASEKDAPDLLELIGVVAIGTLCDIMELKGINRAIIKYALSNNRYPIGINHLAQTLNLKKISSADDLGFFIGPALNAAGRLDDPHTALRLLFSECDEEASKIASQLVTLNNNRKAIEKGMVAEALAMIEVEHLSRNPGLCVYKRDWHEGVIGIVAGKLKEKFSRPAFVISLNKDGIGKGSARSIPGLHVGELLANAVEGGLLIGGGGHSQAGGFSIAEDKIPKFTDFINSSIKPGYVPALNIDCTITPLSDLTQIALDMKVLEPFGRGIEKPIFCMRGVKVAEIKETSSGTHLMLWLRGECTSRSVKAMLFNYHSRMGIVTKLEKGLDTMFDVAGHINVHEQYGPSFLVEDMRLSQ
ncbi:MAG: single-stranded-DNA-specific exonuclease RecJ [Holosporales bacterium]|jgi:single-stranded-DNA-specific exonuclease|nr:single-stranded-DNA-specific exonuclease RecJ [Holosporales bacterium]